MATSEEQESSESGSLIGHRRRGGEGPRLSNAASEARESIETLLGDWRDMVDEQPLKALGIALGAGYVVGGGLLTPLTGRLLFGALRMGFRLAALPLVREELMSFFETSAAARGRGEKERRHQ